MVERTEDERLKRLRVLAGSSVVGADLKWLLDEYDRLQIDNRALADTAAHALNEKQSRAHESHQPDYGYQRDPADVVLHGAVVYGSLTACEPGNVLHTLWTMTGYWRRVARVNREAPSEKANEPSGDRHDLGRQCAVTAQDPSQAPGGSAARGESREEFERDRGFVAPPEASIVKAFKQSPRRIEPEHQAGCWKLQSPSGQGICNCGAENVPEVQK